MAPVPGQADLDAMLSAALVTQEAAA